jgi:hypothetical protein
MEKAGVDRGRVGTVPEVCLRKSRGRNGGDGKLERRLNRKADCKHNYNSVQFRAYKEQRSPTPSTLNNRRRASMGKGHVNCSRAAVF